MGRLIMILGVICAIWVLYQIWVVEKEKRSNEEKLLWTLLALLFNIITAGIFYFLEKNKENKDENK